MLYKPDIDQVRQRLYAFWNNEYTGRALVSVVAPKYEGANISMFHNDVRDMEQDPAALLRYWTDPETICRNAENRLQRTFLGGETLPVVFQNFGTSGHCCYFGCKPTYGNDTIWFDPVWRSLEDVDHTYTEEPLERQLAITRYLCEHGKDKFFVSMPDNCGTIDAIAHLYGSVNLMMDMLAEPELVTHAIQVVNEAWSKANDRFYQQSKELNGGGCHAWMHLLAPGMVNHMQCDLSVMISPEMYEQFVLPELLYQVRHIDYPVYHFDGIEQTKHLPYILSLEKLQAIQWTEVAGQPSPSHYLDTLRRIQKAGKKLIVMAPIDDVKPLLENLSAKGLYIHTEARNEQEAVELIHYVEKNSREVVE